MSVEARTNPKTPARLVNIPNALSVTRLVVGVATLLMIELEWFGWALTLFLIAAITDTLDGYVARLLNQETAFGRQLDPMVDKLLIAAVLIYLVGVPDSGVPAWIATIIVIRELVIQWLRSLMEGQGVAFGARAAGKLKTVFQCVAISVALFLLSLGSQAPLWMHSIRDLLFWSAVFLTVYSGFEYFVAAAPRLRGESPPA